MAKTIIVSEKTYNEIRDQLFAREKRLIFSKGLADREVLMARLGTEYFDCKHAEDDKNLMVLLADRPACQCVKCGYVQWSRNPDELINYINVLIV